MFDGNDPDDWYDPDDDWYDDTVCPEKEAPDCGDCNDAGSVRAGRVYALLRRQEWRPCRACTPNRLDVLRWSLRGRWLSSCAGRSWRRVKLRLQGVELSDEPPF